VPVTAHDDGDGWMVQPSEPQYLSGGTWVPEHAAALVICIWLPEGCQVLSWAVEEIPQVLATLYAAPCSPHCVMRHSVLIAEPGKLTVTRGPADPPVVASLAEELRRCYPRAPLTGNGFHDDPRRWRTPREHNPPQGGAMNEAARRAAEAAAVEQAQPDLTPHPQGLAGRIADARAEAERTLAPADWMLVRALEAVETAERVAEG
jgi:hypothetical protein